MLPNESPTARATEESHMTDDAGDIAVLRTKLRGVNIAYSALVRRSTAQDRFARMAELRTERHALMALIAARSDRGRGGASMGPADLGAHSFTRPRRHWRPWGAAHVVALLRLRTRTLAHSLRGLA
jgi:hypothetical protein